MTTGSAMASGTGVGPGASSVGVVVFEGVLDFPQDHGAYHEPFRIADEGRTRLGVEAAPVRQVVHRRELVRHDGAENAEFLGTEENCQD